MQANRTTPRRADLGGIRAGERIDVSFYNSERQRACGSGGSRRQDPTQANAKERSGRWSESCGSWIARAPASQSPAEGTGLAAACERSIAADRSIIVAV